MTRFALALILAISVGGCGAESPEESQRSTNMVQPDPATVDTLSASADAVIADSTISGVDTLGVRVDSLEAWVVTLQGQVGGLKAQVDMLEEGAGGLSLSILDGVALPLVVIFAVGLLGWFMYRNFRKDEYYEEALTGNGSASPIERVVTMRRSKLPADRSGAEIGQGGAIDEVGVLKERVINLDRRVAEMEGEKRWSSAPAAPGLPDQPVSGGAVTTTHSLASADPLSGTFVDWCRSAGPMVNRAEMFSRQRLMSAMPNARLTIVYRDLDSGEPRPTFRTTQDGVISLAEYWLVSVDAEHFVLPQPLNKDQFRDTNGVYTGAASPATIRSIQPATVGEEGGRYVLRQSGTLQ